LRSTRIHLIQFRFLPLESRFNSSNIKCGVVRTIQKSKNREIVELHYQRKEEKLRQRIHKEQEDEKQLAKETEELEKEKQENFVFQLAEESLAASENGSDVNVPMKQLPPAYKRYDYPVNEDELTELKRQLNEKPLHEVKQDRLLPTSNLNKQGEENGIDCGQTTGNRVVLRGFHDRLCTEPRGQKNYYHLKSKGSISCPTHSNWLDTLVNDPDILVSSIALI
jgi:hypothetical protein